MPDIKLFVQTEDGGDLVEVMTGEQVAEVLGVNMSRVRQLAGKYRRGPRFPGALQVARTWLIPVRDVLALTSSSEYQNRRSGYSQRRGKETE